MLSKIEQVEMLIALGKGDKYRLMHIRESLERGKELYISDKDFLGNLVKTHLGDKIYQARVVSIPEKTSLFCEECGSEIPANEKFCTNCGTQKPEPETTPDKPNLFCEDCGSEIPADENFCTNCGTQKPEPSSPSTSDVPEPTPEPEIELEAESGEQESGGFTFTDSGEMVETSTRKTVQRKPKPKPTLVPKPSDILSKFSKKSRQQELEEYEKKYLGKSKTKVSRKTHKVKATRKTAQIKLKPQPKKKSRQEELEEYEQKYLKESATRVTWKAYDVKAKRKVEIQNPKAVKMKNGKWAVKGTSPITGIKVFRIVGSEKPEVTAEKTADSPKVKKEQTAPAEKPKGSQKTEPEVFSRYYRSPEAESPKPKKAKSEKPNLFCEECGSKIAAKDMFCTNCGAKR